jgi:hypothetical protein
MTPHLEPSLFPGPEPPAHSPTASLTHALVQQHAKKQGERSRLNSSSAASSWAMRRVGTREILPASGAGQFGGMFWLSRNTFAGSYFRFSARSRSYFASPYASRTRVSPSSMRKLT